MARWKILAKSMVIKQNKDIRKQYKHLRDSLSINEINEFSNQICKRILALLDDFKGANIFLCFYPFGSEVDLKPLYQELLAKGKTLYFPVSDLNNHRLHFHSVSNLDLDFHKGCYDIMEPNFDLPILENSDENTIVITPGLIFDNDCNRIGYGAGFYDRFFASNPNVIKIGACFEMQVVPKIESKEYDVPLDYIVTNDRLIKRG